MGELSSRAVLGIGEGVVAAILGCLLVGVGTDRQAALCVRKLIISRPDTAYPIVGDGGDGPVAHIADGTSLLRDGGAIAIVVARRVRSALRVLPHTGIRIHPCCVVLEQVGLGEATTDWIIITRPIVEQAGFAVQALAGEGVDRETEGKGFGAASSNYLNSSK